MTDNVIFRLARVIGVGALALAAVAGSVWMSQVDTLMTAAPAPDSYSLPTPTLFPTLLAATAAPAMAEGSTPLAPTATPRISEEPTLPASSETPVVTEQPSVGTEQPSVGTERPQVGTETPVPCMLPASWMVYTVRTGDTFYGLARQGQTNLQALLQGNCLSEIRALELGEEIFLPAIAQATPTQAGPTCGAPAGWPIVIVRRGETLYGLSIRYGTTVAALRRANCLTSDLVKAGDPLFVPPYIVVPPTVPPTVIWWTPEPLPTAIPTASPTPAETATPMETPTATVEPSPTPTPTETPVLVPTWTPPVWTTVTPTPTPSPTLPPATSTAVPTESPTADATSAP